ncbi:MAG: LPS assembly lipoprotein LptE [Gallionella sp.]
MRTFQKLALLIAVMLLGGCGFHLREQEAMPFNSIYVDTPNQKSLLVSELRHDLDSSKVKLADSAEHADVVLDIISENPDKQILTLDSSGRVTEFRLIYRVSLRAYDHQKQNWIPPEVLELHRDFSYDDSLVLAKESEEALLSNSMRTEMADQIVRRLSLAKPQPQ